MAMAYESGKNKHFVLLTSIDGHEMMTGATFHAYTGGENPEQPLTEDTTVKVTYVPAKGLYELSKPVTVLTAEKDGKFAILNGGSDQAPNYDF